VRPILSWLAAYSLPGPPGSLAMQPCHPFRDAEPIVGGFPVMLPYGYSREERKKKAS
jgi:hypothetical protein